MSEVQQRLATKKFVDDWKDKGDEKQDTQRFWLSFLQNVSGVDQPTEIIEFEKTVQVDNNDGTTTQKYIDGYLPATRTLIEQKGQKIDLTKAERQSDGALLTPYQQARRYGGALPNLEQPRWIIVSNFQSFEIHDMNRPLDEPEVVALVDLPKEAHRLKFLVASGAEQIRKETAISLKAGEVVGALYDELLAQYKNPNDPETLKSLNKLCVRLVFCLYADSAGVFGGNGMFHDYLKDVPVTGMRKALIELFKVLDQLPENRDPYLADDSPALAAFPYVNGGLFEDEGIEIPPFTAKIKALLLKDASESFDWAEISPTIFGSVFESTLNPETRRSGGMHYTTVENIHKVIGPLFLDDLEAELAKIDANEKVKSTRAKKLKAFQRKLAGLTFLDPACGSGNFLTQTYISLRRLENKALSLLHKGQIMFDVGDPIKVSIGQFFGIEINDFAVAVAKTALWIAESQTLKETEEVVQMSLDFLPLKSYSNIIEGNALRMDWESVVAKDKLNYIMGNPPFQGARIMNAEQKSDVKAIFAGWKNAGNLDYVACWYKKAADMMAGTTIRTALVSTNSITQGEAVANLWGPLFEMGVHIDFAYRTFRWDSEAKGKAHVHCVIVGFSMAPNPAPKVIYTAESSEIVQNINGYLVDGANVFVANRNTPICAGAPDARSGSKPIDDGNYLFTQEEMEEFVRTEPAAKNWFRPWFGSQEYIKGKPRYCLWLGDCPPEQLHRMPECLKRVRAVQEYRKSSQSPGTRKIADTPTRFHVETIPAARFLAMPLTSSERRQYVPIGFLEPPAIPSNLTTVVEDADMYDFGVLTSNVFMAWMRAVAGRLKSDYRITKNNVYNNFPWPTPTPKQKAKIEQTAQAILDVRDKYPDSSMAALYDVSMPPDLVAAHRANDRAVMEAYGFPKDMEEPEIVAALMKRYQKLTEAQADTAAEKPGRRKTRR